MNSVRFSVVMGSGLVVVLALAAALGCSPTKTTEQNALTVIGKVAGIFGCRGCAKEPNLEEAANELLNRLDDADTDSDGRLSLLEAQTAIVGLTPEQFESLDLNDDGFVDTDELLVAIGQEPSEGEPVEGEPEEGEPEAPEMLPVAAGTFERGNPWGDGETNEVPVHDVYLDAYEIGKFSVTNQQYADVLNWALAQGYLTNSSGGAYTQVYAYGQPIADTQSSSSLSQITYSGGAFTVRSQIGYNSESFSMADHPMVRVSWYGAVAYCNWLSMINGLQPCYDTSNWTRYEPARNGYRLPTVAEWERAAAWDGSRHWRYGMTSDTIDFTCANYLISGGNYANPLGLTSEPYTSPVGWYNGVNPARLSTPGTLTMNATSPVGAYDMSGNVFEWCHDWSRVYTTDPVSNPTGPGSGLYRELRGGYWHINAYSCRAAYRNGATPSARYYYGGFRVARASD